MKLPIKKKYFDLKKEEMELQFKLYTIQKVLTMYEMDISAKQNNLTVKYEIIPNSTWGVRLEYDSKVYDNITINEIAKNIKVK